MRPLNTIPYLLGTILICISNVCMMAQSDATSLKIHQLLQEKCISCHQATDPAGGLDLSGSPVEVYNQLVGATPNNAMAASKGDKLVMPGHPYRSFLLRKIHNGICPTDCHLATEEQDVMENSHNNLTNIESETIRQWILDGASPSRTVNEMIIEDYYNEGGLERLKRPAGPDPSEGFQVHLGPIFLAPTDEKEYFIKHNVNLPDDIEINRIEAIMNDFSHHFILYKFRNTNTANSKADGLRPLTNAFDAFGGGTDMVSSWQYSQDIQLPAGTAYTWEQNTILDFNYHIPNYSNSDILASDVYLNIYTQPKGTAVREMKADLLLYNGNGFFCLSPTANAQVLTDINTNFNDWNIWLLASHTHQLGTDYDVYFNNNGQKGQQIFEGEIDNYYDWSHPPTFYYEPFVFLPSRQGLLQEAKYQNNTGEMVCFGLTTEDEMMLTLIQYIEGDSFPFVAMKGVADSYCLEDGAIVSLEPTPTGGILAGPGIIGEQFVPSSVGVGKHLLTYTYPFEGESIVAKKEVVVYPNPSLPTIQQEGDLLQVTTNENYTYQWFLDGTAIATANTATHLATSEGDYMVIVTNENGCTSSSLPFPITTTSTFVQETIKTAVQAYPNPITNEFYLQYTVAKPTTVELNLFNIAGSVVASIVHKKQEAGMHQYTLSDEVTTLPSGIYFVQGFIGGEGVRLKLIKH